jgi:hypothetical protein
MTTARYVIAAALAWTAVGYKLRDLRRDPQNPTLRAFWISITVMAMMATTSIPPVYWRLENATGFLAIWTTGLILLGCAALQTTVLLWTHPPQQAWSKIRVRLLLFSLAAMIMIALVLRADNDTARANLAAFAENPELLYGRTPYVAESIMVCLGMIGYTAADMVWHFLRYARLVDRHWLRRGLRLMAISSMFALAYSLITLASVVALRLDLAIHDRTRPIAALLANSTVLVFIAGSTMPAWGPKLQRLRAYRQLRPLWRALCQATPEVVFDAPNPRRLGRWLIPDLDFRLYRRIIEIRDSRLALRPYLDQDAAAAARRLARAAGLHGDALRAVIEASVLADAVYAKADGRPAQAHPMDDTPGGMDLAGELAWLTEVAKAFAGSPIVAAIAARANDHVGQCDSATRIPAARRRLSTWLTLGSCVTLLVAKSRPNRRRE